jgi:hypothetical protein
MYCTNVDCGEVWDRAGVGYRASEEGSVKYGRSESEGEDVKVKRTAVEMSDKTSSSAEDGKEDGKK